MSSLSGLFVHVTGEDGLPWLAGTAAGTQSGAGIRVTPDGALSLAAYYACVRVIGEDIGKLPFMVFEDLPNGDKNKLVDHWAYKLLHDEPNSDMSSMSFRETLTSHAAGWGGGFAEIEWNAGRTQAKALHPIHPSRVTVKRDADGRLGYAVRTNDIGNGDVHGVWIEQADMFHLHGLGPHGTTGYPIASLARETIGLGLAEQGYASDFFANDASPSGVFVHPSKLGADGLKVLRETWEKGHKGSGNHHKVAFLQEDMKWLPMSVNPATAQLIESRNFTIEEVCRWFRMSPHKIQHLLRSTFSNIEHQAIEHVGDCLQPWAVRWEQEAKRKLFVKEPGVYAEHVFAGLLRGDLAQQTLHYRQMFSIGVYSINQILRLQNMNGIGPLGDLHFVPANMIPLEKAAAGETQAAKTGPGSDVTGAPANSTDTLRAAYSPVVADAMHRVMSKESKAVGRAAQKFDGDAPGFSSWVHDFFLGQADYVIDALEPASASLALLGAGDGQPDRVRRYARQYVSAAIDEVQNAFSAGTVDDWCRARGNGEAMQAADQAMDTLMEASHAA